MFPRLCGITHRETFLLDVSSCMWVVSTNDTLASLMDNPTVPEVTGNSLDILRKRRGKERGSKWVEMLTLYERARNGK